MTTTTLIALAVRVLFALAAIGFAFLNLRAASRLSKGGHVPWAGHFLLVSNVWSAAALVIAAVASGGLK